VLVCVKTSRKGGQGGSAERGGNVGAGEQDALRRQGIEVGRLNVRMVHIPVIGPCLIVRDNEHDVGSRAVSRECKQQGEEKQSDGTETQHGLECRSLKQRTCSHGDRTEPAEGKACRGADLLIVMSGQRMQSRAGRWCVKEQEGTHRPEVRNQQTTLANGVGF
jgi:hypothetical protein